MAGKPIKTAKKVGARKQSCVEEAALLVLQELKREEAALIREKQGLATLEERLQGLTSEEIEVKEPIVKILASNVAVLKRQCEEIEISLETSDFPSQRANESSKFISHK